MKQPGVRHWLVVLLAAVFAHGAAFAAWHMLNKADSQGATGYGTRGIRIALAPAHAAEVRTPAQAAPMPATRPKPEPKPQPAPPPKPEPEPAPAPEPQPKPEPQTTQTDVPAPEPEHSKPDPEPEPEPAPEPKPQPDPEPKPEPPPKPEPEPQPKPQPEPQPELEPEPVSEPQPETTTSSSPGTANVSAQGAAPTQGEQFRAGTTGSVADTPPSYRQELRAWLARHKTYPRRARRLRQEGTAVLYFVMDRNGRVLDWEIRQSSGHALLDQAVKELIKSANPMPALPDGVAMQRLALTVPIRYRLQ